jgi:hypothetical protein
MGFEVAGHWKSTGRSMIMSKDKRKWQHGRYLLNAAREYARALKRREGSSGAASPVRHIYNRHRDGAL